MIRFACPGCSATFTVTDDKAGKTGKCPKCQTQFTIPAPAAGPPAAPPPPVPNDPPPMTTVEAPPPIPTVEAPPPHEPIPSVEAPPPMPPPVAPPSPNEPVEIVPCPKCSSRLSVLPSDVGLDVECPNCQTVYRATRADAPPTPRVESPSGRPMSSVLVKYGSGAKKNRDDDEDDDRPSRRRKKRSRRDDDDDEDDDDRPVRRRRSRRSGRRYEPHRGTLILVFGILGLFISAIFGIVAWILGSADLKEMDAGRMDPEGRSNTQIGVYLGMASVILTAVVVLCVCLFYGCLFGACMGGGVGGAGGR